MKKTMTMKEAQEIREKLLKKFRKEAKKGVSPLLSDIMVLMEVHMVLASRH